MRFAMCTTADVGVAEELAGRRRWTMPSVSLNDIESTTLTALMRHGATEDIATDVAHAVRTAESRGNKI